MAKDEMTPWYPPAEGVSSLVEKLKPLQDKYNKAWIRINQLLEQENDRKS